MSHRRRTPGNDPFQRDDEAGETSLARVDAAIFGEFAALDDKRQIAEPVDIRDIYPDITQPRRAIPSVVRHAFADYRPETVGQLFETWLRLVNTERQENGQYPLYLPAYLEGQNTERSDDDLPERRTIGVVEAAFLKVVELAASIRRDGLTNPITVVQRGKQYTLETGERRWLAFHLLHLWFDGTNSERPDEHDQWSKIPARSVDKISVWRQATENSARENLNAVGKARQFAILLMDLLRAERGRFVSFRETVEPGGCDRGYYAQVANAKQWRVPRGKSELLLGAMGVADRSSLSRYRDLLSLPDAVWQIGDDYNLSEETLYELAHRSPEEAVAEAQRIVESFNNSQESGKLKRVAEEVDRSPGSRRHFVGVVRALSNAGPGKETDNEAALQGLQELEDWIAQERRRIQQFRNG